MLVHMLGYKMRLPGHLPPKREDGHGQHVKSDLVLRLVRLDFTPDHPVLKKAYRQIHDSLTSVKIIGNIRQSSYSHH